MESSALHLLLPLSSCPSSLRSCSWTPSSLFHLHSRTPSAILTFGSRSRARLVAPAASSEEDRWLREEQRWLREEQRWLREEARWEAERRLMAAELALLKREMEHLRGQVQERRSSPLPSVIASLKQLVQSLPVSEEQPRPNIEFVHTEEEEEEEEVEEIAPSVSAPPSVSVSDHPSMLAFSIDLAPPEVVPRTELRKGAEGDEVKALQEALEALGFYSGEEDIEYSIFAEGTETAMKSWQSSLGVREDGVASPKLLAILFGEEAPAEKPNVNGRKEQQQQSPDPWKAPAAKAKTSGKKSFAEDKLDVENTRDGEMAANRRVFLLGENRWEEPDRLTPSRASAAKASNGVPSSTAATPGSTSTTPLKEEERCFTCKGEGVSMCTECEGTGELNVEDQFLDWVEEGAKCPYCEGSGAIPCDVCLGKGAVSGAPVV